MIQNGVVSGGGDINVEYGSFFVGSGGNSVAFDTACKKVCAQYLDNRHISTVILSPGGSDNFSDSAESNYLPASLSSDGKTLTVSDPNYVGSGTVYYFAIS